jgi:aspartate aminotransferase-like enzyme
MARPIIHHRTPQFQVILKEVFEGLKYVFQTKNDVLVFASSGTGAMEASVVNLLSAGDSAVVIRGGKFGERFGEICEAYGINVIPVDVEWGKAVEPSGIAGILQSDVQKKIKVVFVTLCETSTGVINDIKALGRIVSNTDAVLVVDTISGLGAVEFKTDEWNVDVAVAGSQKGLMIPPGLAFVSISPKAWRLVEQAKCPRYYFDFGKSRKALKDADTPFTPAVSLIIGLAETLRMIRAEGLEPILNRHRKMAAAIRNAATALGLDLYAPSASSDAVTAIKVPAGIDGEKLVKTMRDKYGVTIAGGQSELKGRVFRIASMGFMTQFDVIVAISCLEIVLSEMGYKFQLGSGVRAAEEVMLSDRQ